MNVIDFETRSKADLRAVGSRKYLTDPTTEVMCLSSWDGHTLRFWIPPGMAPKDIGSLDCRSLAPARGCPVSVHQIPYTGGGPLAAHNATCQRAAG